MKRLSSADDLRVANTGPAMEKVTILRRVESLDSKIKSKSRKEAFFFFSPFFLIFLLGLFCLLMMMISIYSLAEGTDPTMPRSEAMDSLAVAVQEKIFRIYFFKQLEFLNLNFMTNTSLKKYGRSLYISKTVINC